MDSKSTTSFLVSMTNYILTHNYFSFEGITYKQIRSTAMGTHMTPSCANLFMGHLEESFLKTQNPKPLTWFKFTDDIFAIWIEGEDTIFTFLQHLNNFSPICFTWCYSTQQATFLNVDLHLRDGYISTSVHIKPTNHQQYPHFDSSHPFHTKKSLPYSLGTRGRRICSDEQSLSKYTEGLTDAFTDRNYPPILVQKQISHALSFQSPTTSQSPTVQPQRSIPLVTQYHPGLEQLNYILCQGFDYLSSCPEMRNVVSTILPTHPTVVFRRPPNLHNTLVHSYTTPAPNPLPHGSYPCNRPRCNTCPISPTTTTCSSPVTNITYPIKGRATCETSHVIYKLSCNHCAAFCVGMTTNKLSVRINSHRQTVAKKQVDHPVAEHAAKHDIPHLNDCFTACPHPSRPLPVPIPALHSHHFTATPSLLISFIFLLSTTYRLPPLQLLSCPPSKLQHLTVCLPHHTIPPQPPPYPHPVATPITAARSVV
ncbi:uncharacterized protein LOC126465520 [Schistocerca serialis cubense]|uniref:uncharacterized protein LOC126465520 n=1 Tax=Schistocerca serialis cubense TaxID=2023355 RepID=UPI00214DFB26|nr:uncharacterized protein LOC126465520 [Schistocerca serialis cubense]